MEKNDSTVFAVFEYGFDDVHFKGIVAALKKERDTYTSMTARRYFDAAIDAVQELENYLYGE